MGSDINFCQGVVVPMTVALKASQDLTVLSKSVFADSSSFLIDLTKNVKEDK